MLRATLAATAVLAALLPENSFTANGFVVSRGGMLLQSPAKQLCSSPVAIRGKVGAALRMSTDAEQEEKVRRAIKLAEDAQAAMDAAKEAEAKANLYRGKVVNLDPSSEVRTRKILGKIGGVFYRHWTGILTGRGDGVGKDPLGLGDSFYQQGPEERHETIQAIFKRFDTDGNGGIDEAELGAGLKEVLGYNALETVEVAELLREADLDKNGVIDAEEFETMVALVLEKGEAETLEASQRAADAARSQARSETTAAMVREALQANPLVGDAAGTSRVLDDLKQQGGLKLWDTAGAVFYPTGADKMKALTGMKEPEKDLGLDVDPWTRFRYQGVGFLGISGAVSLIVAAFLPPMATLPFVIYGYGTLLVNVVTTALGPQLDKTIQNRLIDGVDNADDRWVLRQAGRFLGAYLCGVPIESSGIGPQGRLEILPYSRKSGNVDMESLRKSVDAEGQLTAGLTKREIDKQSIIQMTGLCAELRKYGKASMGYRFFVDLDYQIDLSQKAMDRREKQVQARYGVTQGYTLLEQHSEAFEELVQAIKEGRPTAELIAIIEASAQR